MAILLANDPGSFKGMLSHLDGQTIEYIGNPVIIRDYYCNYTSPPIESYEIKVRQVRSRWYSWMAWLMKTGDLP